MPTYEYACSNCQNQWEEIQKISAAPVEVCPKCGQQTAKRQISGGSFILKGGGWYSDLYSSAKPAKAEGSPTSTPAKSESPATASAPAAAPAPKVESSPKKD